MIASEESSPLRLLVTLKTHEGLSWQLCFQQSPLIVGRGERSDIRLPYPWVSLQHAEICWSEEGITARDLIAKTPARYRGDLLTNRPTPRSPTLTISLPSISLSFILSTHQRLQTSADQSAYITRQLWRPESGWLLWTASTTPVLTVRRLAHLGSSLPARPKTPPEPLLSHQWRSALSHKDQYAHDVQGLCWFINDLGHYEINHLTDTAPILLVLGERSIHLNGDVHEPCEDNESYSFVCHGVKLILTREAHPPLTQLFRPIESGNLAPWWSRIFSSKR